MHAAFPWAKVPGKEFAPVPLLLGGIVLVLFALLSLSASEGEAGRKKAFDTVIGSIVVSILCFVFVRAGAPWLAALLLLGSAGRSFYQNRQRLGSARSPGPPPAPRMRATSGEMSRDEAYAILGVQEGASRDAILEAYKRLMKKMHPDQGGSTYLAQRINQARDVLVGK